MKAFESIKIVFYKETVDHLRDRRSLTLSLVFPLLAPILVGILLYFVNTSNIQGQKDFIMDGPVAGAEYAPRLMEHLTDHGIVIKPAPLVREFQEDAVKRGDLPFILVIPPEAAGQNLFKVEIIMDRGSPKSLAAAATILRHVTIFGRQESRRMLEASGLDPRIVTPITVTERNIGKTLNTAFLFYNMIPSLLTFMIFMGAVYLAIDVSVGERERGSLESLLATPIERSSLLLGKSLTALFFTAIIILINLVAFYIALHLATGGVENVDPPPGALVFLKLFVISLPLMAFAVALQMAIAFMSKSAKEAQIYLGLLPIIPLLPGLVMIFSPVDPSSAISAIPIYGQLALFIDIIGGRDPTWGNVMYSVVGTMSGAMIIFYAASRLFEREKTVLGF
ncbi:MAG: ABC transporter permease [Proteobacteria bacterium]|nr:ABC transporter permease [Pseudomonadota bacterium]